MVSSKTFFLCVCIIDFIAVLFVQFIACSLSDGRFRMRSKEVSTLVAGDVEKNQQIRKYYLNRTPFIIFFILGQT